MGVSVTDIEQTYKTAIDLGAIPVREPRLIFSEGKKIKNAFIKGLDGENIELMEWMK